MLTLLRWYPLIFLVRLPLYYLGYVIYPGETFVLPLLFVFAIRLRFSNVILLAYILCVFLTFERGTLLNMFIASALLVQRANLSLRSILRWMGIVLILIIAMPIVGRVLGNFYDLRIDLSFGEMVDFVLSIFGLDDGSNESLSGTRNHRFEMWLLLLREMYLNGTSRFLFGVGFSGEILDLIGVGFRAPHNGYVSIFVRMGLVGLFCYILALWGILKDLRLRESKVILLIFCLDMLVQTTIDSPFVPFMSAYLMNASEDGILFRS
ncbi:O-antigen ligase family protein [Schleiferiaceae bacterium]|nr:O-antigen ligase family protein [Schleiferiaceae bacterium]